VQGAGCSTEGVARGCSTGVCSEGAGCRVQGAGCRVQGVAQRV